MATCIIRNNSSFEIWFYYISGYINEAGDLNLTRFEMFMQELAKIDKEKFQDTYTDLKYFEGKTGRRPNANERKEVTFRYINILLDKEILQ